MAAAESDGLGRPGRAGRRGHRKAGDHGAWAAPQYYAARAITLSVTASAPTQALRDLARALLQQAVPISDLATFAYNEPVPKQAAVRRREDHRTSDAGRCDVQHRADRTGSA